ncbi:hypothetical protein [Microbacterium mangrovi]|uniref:hypothetical protein n=1 Tax=Microbacterium mangrovi TaxID=1348253 RepID=UPI0012E0A4ED|nr:hypothetical protein [Microbacterium mangrovi]
MTGQAPLNGRAADDFFDAAVQSLTRRMGNVSFAKFLGEASLGDAKSSWLTGVNSFVSALPDGVFLGFDTASGDPILQFAGGMVVRIHLWRVTADLPVEDAWQANMTVTHLPIVVEAVGYRLWGEPWAEAVRGRATDLSASSGYAWSERSGRWFIQVAPNHGPGASFVCESHAQRAASAYAIGIDEVVHLFETWRAREQA